MIEGKAYTNHMKQFLIHYTFSQGSESDWHEDIRRSIEVISNRTVTVTPLEVIAETA